MPGVKHRTTRRLRLTAALAALCVVAAACSSSTATRDAAPEGAPEIADASASPRAPSATTRTDASGGTDEEPDTSATGDPTDDTTTGGGDTTEGSATTGGDTDGGATAGDGTTGGDSDTTTGDDGAGSDTTTGTTDGTASDEPWVLGVAAASNNAMGQVGMSAQSPSDDRTRRWIEALRDHINDDGGVAGRELKTVIRFVDQSDQSEANQTRLQTEVCTEFTEDLGVDMVVGDATSWVLECYAQHDTPLFNPVVTRDKQQLDPVRPWVLPSFFLTFDRVGKLFPVSLAQQDWISEKMGVFTFDLPWYERAIQDHLIPGIEAQGGKVLEVARAKVNADAVAAATQSAVVKFKDAGIDHVIIFANGGGAYLLFAQAADQQAYHPNYGLSTLDRPWVFTDLVPPTQRNVRGFGFWPTLDVDPESQPPPSELERKCWEILNERANENFRFRNPDSQLASAVCDFMFLVDAGIDQGAGRDFSRPDVPSLYWELGDSYRSITIDQVDFSRGRYDAVKLYRNLMYDFACACTRYTTDSMPIPFD